jgi:hypothetical protein
LTALANSKKSNVPSRPLSALFKMVLASSFVRVRSTMVSSPFRSSLKVIVPDSSTSTFWNKCNGFTRFCFMRVKILVHTAISGAVTEAGGGVGVAIVDDGLGVGIVVVGSAVAPDMVSMGISVGVVSVSVVVVVVAAAVVVAMVVAVG